MREKYPEPYSSYICFVRAVAGQKFSREMISKWFGRLVEKDDYVLSERNGLVAQLHSHSNPPEEKGFGSKNRPGAVKISKSLIPPVKHEIRRENEKST